MFNDVVVCLLRRRSRFLHVLSCDVRTSKYPVCCQVYIGFRRTVTTILNQRVSCTLPTKVYASVVYLTVVRDTFAEQLMT